jgi:hypothetical protein
MKVEKKGGRIKGTPNKVTHNLRNQIETILQGYFDKLDFDQLKDQDKILLVSKLLNFVLPKLQSVEVKDQPKHEPFNIIYLGNGIEPTPQHHAKN